MRISCNFDNLTAVLNKVAVAVEDALNAEDMKNLIFRVTKETGEVEVIGINQIITYRVSFESGSYTTEVADEEYKDSGVVEFQVKSKELNSFLNAFKSIRRTTVSGVNFETVKNKVVVTVIESDNETGREYASKWMLDNLPIKPNMLSSINLQVPEEVQPCDISALQLYTSSLLPIMQNGANLYSKLAIGEKSVVAFNATFTTLMTNFLGDLFKDFCISYRALSFIKSVFTVDDLVEVAKTEERLCFRSSNSVAFIRYDKKMPNFEIYERMIDKSHAIVLDRQYLKDVLKRLSLVNESITFKIDMENEVVEVRNSKFDQQLPVLQSKAMAELGEISFKILPEVLTKAIIGDDAVFSQTVFMYLAPQEQGGYTLIFSDDSGNWTSVARIR